MLPPLAERMRPVSFETYIGQTHLVGPNGTIRKNQKSGFCPNMILWGPPGVGKTTLAHVIARETKRELYAISAVNAGVKEVREILEKAQSQRFFDAPSPLFFVDEIHRFNKGQQDALLHALEKGIVTFIGATTENPSFEVNSALLSRCQVFVLQPLSESELRTLIQTAILKDEVLSKIKIQIPEDELLLTYSGGDARKLYNLLEILVMQAEDGTLTITNELVQNSAQQFLTLFDKGGEQHYDIASAFIKSIRGSDPNAALYWMARMIKGGEPPEFIARRLMISAAEDIGLANPNALIIASHAAQAASMIGWPESRIVLAEAAVYLACSPKSNSSYTAIDAALAEVDRSGSQPVPLHLRNAPTRLMKELGYGKHYQYDHDAPQHFSGQSFLPEELQDVKFYEPGRNELEEKIMQRLISLWPEKYPKK